MTLDLAGARSLLFVPGNRPELFDKASSAGADLVILDLEDAVAPVDKAGARTAIAAWLDGQRPVLLRLNAVGSPWFEDDLSVCDHPGVAGIMLPKAEPGSNLGRVATVRPVIALIETAAGVLGLGRIAATLGVIRLAAGTIDLALDLDITAPEALDPILLQMVVASRAADIASPVAGVTTDFRDSDAVEGEARRARSFGFSGKLCIHPAQIAPIMAGFRASASEREQAQRIVEASVAAGGAAFAHDGRMIDRPIVDRACRLLAHSL